MSEQGKANYEGYRAAAMGKSLISGATLPEWDELSHLIRLAWDAGACSVELWLAEAPVDEDMPGGELASVTAELGRLREQLAEARELGTAWRRERDALAEDLAGIRERLGNLAAGLELSASTSAPSKKSEIEQGCAQAVRGIAEG